jgi:hypothetical protein
LAAPADEREVTVKLREVEDLFHFLGRLNKIYHSEERSNDLRIVQQFWLHGGYDDLRRFYYDVVWDWLPSDVQKQVEDRA